jgi:hypothetical protein
MTAMASNRPTPLDRMRRYVNSLQEADRPSESYVSVALGDLAAVVTLADVLRADHADPDLGWTTAAIEADLYEQAERIKRRLTVLISTRGTPELQEAANQVYDEVAKKDDAKEWGRARQHLVGDLGQVRAALKMERGISAERLTKIGELKKRIAELEETTSPADDDPTENATLRKDVEDLQTEREDWLEEKTALETALRWERDLVHSLRFNGAGHWFAFGWDKPIVMPGDVYQRFCKVCEKDEGHPAHFSSKATYLDSRDVEKSVEAVRKRLVEFLTEGVRLGHGLVRKTALDLLGGLPGVPLAPEPPQEDAEPHCSCGAPRSNHPFKHPFSSAPPNDRSEGTR